MTTVADSSSRKSHGAAPAPKADDSDKSRGQIFNAALQRLLPSYALLGSDGLAEIVSAGMNPADADVVRANVQQAAESLRQRRLGSTAA